MEDTSTDSPRTHAWLGRFNSFVLVCRIVHELLVKFQTDAEASSLFNASNRRFNNLFVRIWQECSRNMAAPSNFAESQQYMNLRKLIKLASNNTFDLIVQGILNMIETKTVSSELLEPSLVQAVTELHELLIRLKDSIAVDINLAGGRSLNKVSVDTLELREMVTEKLHVMFKTYLSYKYVLAPEESKLFVYDNLATFKQRLFEQPRFNIHSCLRDSITYMRNNHKLEADAEETPKKRAKNSVAKLPYVAFKNESTQVLCYTYQIYLECGHMINLHDWLQVSPNFIEVRMRIFSKFYFSVSMFIGVR